MCAHRRLPPYHALTPTPPPPPYFFYAQLSRSKAVLSHDPDCTFAPAINPYSQRLRRRTFSDLSRGDALKKETATRLLRLRLEQEEISGITFKPAINQKSQNAEGRLRVLSEPETYIARLSAEAATQQDKARRAAANAEVNALAECTFTPAVHDAPEYIKRIARSMALTRAVRSVSGTAQKNEWR